MSITDEQINNLPQALQPILRSYWHSYQMACEVHQVEQPSHSDFIASLIRVWPVSDFVAQACIDHPELLTELFTSGDILREYPSGEMGQKLAEALAEVSDEAELMRALRLFRRREMLRIAWRDLAGWADLNFTSQDLSALADTCIELAVTKLTTWLIARFGQPVDKFNKPAELMVVAVGKLGAQELNFSSDVDLMLAYPCDGELEQSGRSYQQFFIILAQQLTKVLSAFTVDGFVFRVDMSLGAYGSSGALAMSVNQLREYYRNQGRDWERYALIKARVITGSKMQRRRLSSLLKQFVYRQYVDFSMIESLRQLQRKISAEVRKHDLVNNVKRGPGGIREVEFIGQTFKLIRGGWQPRLQLRKTIRTILVLRDMGYLTEELADQLIIAYRFLRKVENRLQMQNDRQTHSIPKTTLAKTQLAYMMHCENWDEFQQQLKQHMNFVHKTFEELIARPRMKFNNNENVEKLKDMQKIWLTKINQKKSLVILEAAGYNNTEKTLQLLKHLRYSRANQNLVKDIRQHLDTIVPQILVLATQEKHPDNVLRQAVNILEAVLSHPVYLVLLVENPTAVAQLIRLCAVSPWIVEQIARFPALLDELLQPDLLYAPPAVDELKSLLHQQIISVPEEDIEEQVHALQVFKKIHLLRVAAADITGVLPLMKVSDYLTNLATTVVDKILDVVWQNMLHRYGRPMTDNKGFIIVAYGKLGGIELGYGSDLDLVFLRQDVDSDVMTDGHENISSQLFYTRLAQQLLTLISGQTPAGRLYEVDMRLRPSGDSGLLVSSMSAFENYQLKRAWSWEHQALVRARVIAGDEKLAEQFEQTRKKILAQHRESEELRHQVRQMRERMREAVKEKYSDKFNLKQGVGGIADIEFLVQFIVLNWAEQYPDLLQWTDNIRILENSGIAGIISVDEARLLQKAYVQLRNAMHRLTLQNQPAWIDEQQLQKERQVVTEIFQRMLGEI